MAGFLADVLVTVHVAYVAFVVGGEVFVLLGWVRGWKSIRNCCFRIAHLIAILIVAAEAILGYRCPLTVWEEELRLSAGEAPSGESFVGRLFRSVLFYTDIPQWMFDVAHITFGGIVLLTFVLCPPRCPFRRASPPSGAGV